MPEFVIVVIVPLFCMPYLFCAFIVPEFVIVPIVPEFFKPKLFFALNVPVFDMVSIVAVLSFITAEFRLCWY